MRSSLFAWNAAFQSTFPLRGTTRIASFEISKPRISIHVPLAGNDAILMGRLVRDPEFQSTFPLRGTTLRASIVVDSYAGFQSTFPLRGTTPGGFGRRGRRGISIHVPLAGNDRAQDSTTTLFWHFNPRSPCGERLEQYTRRLIVVRFQSTFPLRGTTQEIVTVFLERGISIHVPLAGNDRLLCPHVYNLSISIHVPLAGNDQSALASCSRSRISIHVPLAGNDVRVGERTCATRYFNPRSPCGERHRGRLALV